MHAKQKRNKNQSYEIDIDEMLSKNNKLFGMWNYNNGPDLI